jgi:adenylate cyclase
MRQGSAQTLERVRWVSSVYRRLVAQAGCIGVAPTDSAELALQERLIVSLSVGLLPLTFLWSVIYFAAGAPLSAAIPGLYMIIAPINTAVFAWNRNLVVYRFVQLLIFLRTLERWAAGGQFPRPPYLRISSIQRLRFFSSANVSP